MQQRAKSHTSYKQRRRNYRTQQPDKPTGSTYTYNIEVKMTRKKKHMKITSAVIPFPPPPPKSSLQSFV